jgi:oligo-1,6-glucosidase
MISKDPELPDGEVPAGKRFAPSFTSVVNGPRLHDYLNEMYREVLVGKNLLTVGEMPGVTVDQARLFTDPARRELNMVFTFEHVGLDQVVGGTKWDLADLPLPVLKANLGQWQTGLGEVGWNSLYWNNHDQPRAVSRYGDDSAEHRVASAKTLGTVLHLLKGTPYVYQGEELGMTNSYFTDIGQYQDIESVNYHADALSLGLEAEVILKSLSVKSRDNARSPVQWDDSSQAGFTTGVPWLTVNPNYVSINAEAAIADPSSVFHHYRKLIALRHDHRVVVHGRFGLLLPEDEQIFAFTRTTDDAALLVLANFSSSAAEVDADGIPSLIGASVLLATHPGGTGLSLAPWESRIYLLG